MARYSKYDLKVEAADSFNFKIPFPGFPEPDYNDLPEIVINPHFPGIPWPIWDRLQVAEPEPQTNDLGELGEMFDGGLFGF